MIIETTGKYPMKPVFPVRNKLDIDGWHIFFTIFDVGIV
jgi:hypothetical protein